MNTITEFIQKQFKLDSAMEKDNFIVEGLIVNDRNHTVTLTDNHNKGVDFSLIKNPVYDIFNGINVISISKRTFLKDYEKDKNIDGNPFIYALKNKFGWKFDIDDKTIIKYCRRFLEICDKINSNYDTIIMVPSKSSINERFMDVIYKKVNAKNKITQNFYKVDLDEVTIEYDKIENDFSNSDEVIEFIREGFRKMNNEFEAKFIDKKYLKYIKYLGNHNPEEFRNKIDGKDILILDDIMSSGTTVSQCVENIQNTFNAKSITVITLLSKAN